ncbi:conserved hypothetical protein [Ricinus communis]|uniref:Uncharacterized protein n=1 Tax=Ricinus communis TaxID=3988 RepID=B9S6Z0_RICCO|nr:conserved hypothetical protein [Ricinus communis]|eukprot:XP_002521759.1 putative defensin-like protein 20 [Ricinus communis]
MAQMKLFSIVLVVALVLCAEYNMNVAVGRVELPVSQADGMCCREHYEFGRCLPGHDDHRCNEFCSSNCRGGFCKLSGKKHHCHCYC